MRRTRFESRPTDRHKTTRAFFFWRPSARAIANEMRRNARRSARKDDYYFLARFLLCSFFLFRWPHHVCSCCARFKATDHHDGWLSGERGGLFCIFLRFLFAVRCRRRHQHNRTVTMQKIASIPVIGCTFLTAFCLQTVVHGCILWNMCCRGTR